MNQARQTSNVLAAEEKSILRTLLYFDIFSYPLTKKEIEQFSPLATNSRNAGTLDKLVAMQLVYEHNEFYMVQNQLPLASRRIAGNSLARKKLKTAQRYSRLIARIPFVRGIMLSGSISKGYMDSKSDIDYFIITEVNRLWIVRTMLAFIRRIFLFNSHKNLCTNYFVDLQNLEIVEKNAFTAIEFSTLVPMYGKPALDQLMQANLWARDFLPNSPSAELSTQEDNYLLKPFLEKILPHSYLDRFNLWLLNKTIQFWRKKYGTLLSDNDFQIAFRSTPGISKSHPQFFQKKVLDRLDQKIKSFEVEKCVDLTL